MMGNNMDKNAIEKIALSIRTLTMDAIQKARSGHPGLPMGLAELGALLFAEIMRHNPRDTGWINRDRFVLSAGHGSMLLYALLHLSGYDLPLEEIKNFRQLDSKTAGHPEYLLTPGVETTTGPLGQGFANGVGMAIAERMLAARFNTDKYKIIDHYTYVISSDGCIMEGVASEAASYAGHLGLGKLIVFYDSNKITIEGSTDLTFSEDVKKRFEAYGWHVTETSAYDIERILKLVEEEKNNKDKPSLIILSSVIARGSATMEGSHKTHGAPLGEEEVAATKRALGVPVDSDFFIHEDAVKYFEGKQEIWEKEYNSWKNIFKAWSEKNSDLAGEWHNCFNGNLSIEAPSVPMFNIGDSIATRAAGGKVIRAIPNFIGGSADLAPSNKSYLEGMGDFSLTNPSGRNLHFGIREHAMGSIINGMALHGGLRPFCATFFVFTDYMRPAIRLAALMKLPVIYVLTHDSIYVGEDGPTHQPVEHLAALRAIPDLLVLRPADAQETEAAWRMALNHTEGPAAIVLTRQDVKVFKKEDTDWERNIIRGAYIAKDSKKEPKVVVVATGSEVQLALEALNDMNTEDVRVVSVISRKLFIKQNKYYKESIIPDSAKCLVIEAGVSFGWEGLAGKDGDILAIDSFGKSGPAKKVAAYFGFTKENVIEKINNLL
jgi:transketolase